MNSILRSISFMVWSFSDSFYSFEWIILLLTGWCVILDNLQYSNVHDSYSNSIFLQFEQISMFFLHLYKYGNVWIFSEIELSWSLGGSLFFIPCLHLTLGIYWILIEICFFMKCDSDSSSQLVLLQSYFSCMPLNLFICYKFSSYCVKHLHHILDFLIKNVGYTECHRADLFHHHQA